MTSTTFVPTIGHSSCSKLSGAVFARLREMQGGITPVGAGRHDAVGVLWTNPPTPRGHRSALHGLFPEKELDQRLSFVWNSGGSLTFVHKIRAGGFFVADSCGTPVRNTSFHMGAYAKNGVLTRQPLIIMLTEDSVDERRDEYPFPLACPDNRDPWFELPRAYQTQNDVLLSLSRNVVYLSYRRGAERTPVQLVLDERTERGLAKVQLFLHQTYPALWATAAPSLTAHNLPTLPAELGELVLRYAGLDGSCDNWQ